MLFALLAIIILAGIITALVLLGEYKDPILAFAVLLITVVPCIVIKAFIDYNYTNLKTWESKVEAYVVTVDGVQFTFVNNPFYDNEVQPINLTKKFNRVFDKKVNLIVRKDSIWTPYNKWVELDKE